MFNRSTIIIILEILIVALGVLAFVCIRRSLQKRRQGRRRLFKSTPSFHQKQMRTMTIWICAIALLAFTGLMVLVHLLRHALR